MAKKVAIIGAGLTGLSAGIFLQKQGIETTILELSEQPGGMCTGWERGGYRFDGCIHWMLGTKSGDAYNKLYLEVGALKPDTPIYNPVFIRTELAGSTYDIPMDAGLFRRFLLNISPEDQDITNEFCDNIDMAAGSEIPTELPTNPFKLAFTFRNSAGFIRLALKYADLTVGEYAMRFQSRLIRAIICELMPPQYTLMALFMMLGARLGGNAGYPLGGAHGIVSGMVSAYRDLGGLLHLKSRADEIVVEKGQATGVKSGDYFCPADAIIAAGDMYDTLYRLLDGRYQHKQLEGMLRQAELFEPLVVVSFGVNQSFDIPYNWTFEYPVGLRTSPEVLLHRLSIRSFDFDSSAAPAGKSSVMAALPSTLDFWARLRQDNRAEYGRYKLRLAEDVARAIERKVPGFYDAVKVIDVATPATYIRHANLYKASWEGFAPTPEAVKTKIAKTVNGVKNLFLAGQWTVPGGGICTAIKSGREAAKEAARALL